MARLATAGVNSCGIMAINGFYHHNVNEDYKQTKHLGDKCSKKHEIDSFISNRVIRLQQKPGQTKSVPFEFLMEVIAANYWGPSKTIIVTLNETQALLNDGYWPKELTRWGFDLIKKFNNKNGETNYFYMRTPLEM